MSPVPLPPGAGTISWIVLPGWGHSCASAEAATSQDRSANAAAKDERLDIVELAVNAATAILARRFPA